MPRLLTLILCVFLLSLVSFAATNKQVSYKSGTETVNAQMYTPEGKGPFPALIVIHEWYGLNDWVKQQAQQLADHGYVTLAVDLYRGKVASSSDEAHELMRGLPEDRVRRDLMAAFDYLASQPNVNKAKIGSIGWCMGGGYSLMLALNEPKLAADVINYGRLVTDDAELRKIQSPVLGNFGGQDRGITPESVNAFEAQMKKLGKRIDAKIYPDAGHAFMNENNKGGYRPEDTKDAWTRIYAFFDKTLK